MARSDESRKAIKTKFRPKSLFNVVVWINSLTSWRTITSLVVHMYKKNILYIHICNCLAYVIRAAVAETKRSKGLSKGLSKGHWWRHAENLLCVWRHYNDSPNFTLSHWTNSLKVVSPSIYDNLYKYVSSRDKNTSFNLPFDFQGRETFQKYSNNKVRASFVAVALFVRLRRGEKVNSSEWEQQPTTFRDLKIKYWISHTVSLFFAERDRLSSTCLIHLSDILKWIIKKSMWHQ